MQGLTNQCLGCNFVDATSIHDVHVCGPCIMYVCMYGVVMCRIAQLMNVVEDVIVLIWTSNPQRIVHSIAPER